ncbi:GGDEF domain-containing protein, partial [Shewanella xiamenensis]|uniref:GGDEF domain-containing protein n=1 Tax=Shewanella xiamenensis TaxID=332186 RepID=UPI00214F7479
WEPFPHFLAVGMARRKCSCIRISYLARYGGEEFMLLLPSSHIEDAYKIAEHLRETIIDLHIPHQGSSNMGIVTISLGIACWQPPQLLDANKLISHVDEALYRAKLAGRNRTEVFIGAH